ncbi:MAG: hypothetical protein WCO16_02315 [bacterium]
MTESQPKNAHEGPFGGELINLINRTRSAEGAEAEGVKDEIYTALDKITQIAGTGDFSLSELRGQLENAFVSLQRKTEGK